MKEVVGFDKYNVDPLGNITHASGRRLKPYKVGGGYYQVKLYAGTGIKKSLYVHVIVASAFVPNPTDLPEVNHIDGDKSNNAASNLEWETRRGNQKHAYDIGLCENTRAAIRNNAAKNGRQRSKPVTQMDLSGNILNTFPSAIQAQRDTGIKYPNILNNIKGKQKQAGGFTWCYLSS